MVESTGLVLCLTLWMCGVLKVQCKLDKSSLTRGKWQWCHTSLEIFVTLFAGLTVREQDGNSVSLPFPERYGAFSEYPAEIIYCSQEVQLQVKIPFHLHFISVIQAEASSWTLQAPSSVKGLPGSCVVIPCSYNYPDPRKTVTQFTGIWQEDTNKLIYHPVASKITQQYQGRTELVGDVRQKNCSLKIDPLQQSDRGPFHFRIEIGNYDIFSYLQNKVSITMISKLD